MTTSQDEHLKTCKTCRKLDELWERIFGEKEAHPFQPRTDPELEWKKPEQPINVMGKPPPPARRGRGGPPPPANTCPGCGGWKKAQYPTCFKCSGLVLCEECEENYHSEEYETCYECGTGEYETCYEYGTGG